MKKMEYMPQKKCRFCEDNINYVNYKDIKSLQRFVSNYNKIESRKKSGNCMKHQRMISTAIKRARLIALIPFTSK